MAKRKKAKLSGYPSPKKHTRISPPTAVCQNPLWAFRHFDTDGRWSWSKIGDPDAMKMIQHLKDYESMTWAQIQQASHCHFIEPSEIIADAQKRLLALRRHETNSLFSMSLGGKARIWGILQDRIMLMLWWDPDHEICPAHKR